MLDLEAIKQRIEQQRAIDFDDVEALIEEVERLRALLPAPGPSLGDRSMCKACGAAIEYIGPYWRHVGPIQPRHIAEPTDWQKKVD